MGCGGSRSDAIEPRRHESWTRETESTWLTSTDADCPNNSIIANLVIGMEMILCQCSANPIHATYLFSSIRKGSVHAKTNELGKGVEARSSVSSKDKRMVNTGIQCGKAPLTSSTCTNQQRSQQMKLESVQESNCSLK